MKGYKDDRFFCFYFNFLVIIFKDILYIYIWVKGKEKFFRRLRKMGKEERRR